MAYSAEINKKIIIISFIVIVPLKIMYDDVKTS